MANSISFGEVVEAADKLSLEEQETLVDILHRRMIEQRRDELVKDIQKAQREFNNGQCEPASPDELMKEILS